MATKAACRVSQVGMEGVRLGVQMRMIREQPTLGQSYESTWNQPLHNEKTLPGSPFVARERCDVCGKGPARFGCGLEGKVVKLWVAS